MKESIEKLFVKMNDDKTFAERLLTQTEKEKVIELAQAEGIHLNLEDLNEANSLIQKAMEAEKLRTEGELSEDELENVAGGIFGIDDLLVIGAYGLILGVSALVSAAATASISGGVTAAITLSINAADQ